VVEYHATLHKRLWRGTVLTLLLGPALYLLAMGVGVGSLVDDDPANAIGGVPYLQYVAPGLLAAAAMQTAMAQSLYPVFGSVKWMRTAYGLAATPLRPADIALGFQAWLGLLLLVGATAFLAMAALAGAVHSPLGLLVPPVAALGGLAYSAGASAWAIGRDSEQSFQPILRLGILPSFLLSGTFFPISQLPGALQAVAAVTPLWHSVTLVRGLTGGTVTLPAAAGHAGVLAGYALVGLLAASRAYRRKLHR
jgi:lipooligosaccharide transport system permease protein